MQRKSESDRAKYDITYRYYRDREKRPMVTVAYLIKDGQCFKGHAICSPRENPDKRKGRAIARERALAAYRRETQIHPRPSTRNGQFFARPVVREEALLVLGVCRAWDLVNAGLQVTAGGGQFLDAIEDACAVGKKLQCTSFPPWLHGEEHYDA